MDTPQFAIRAEAFMITIAANVVDIFTEKTKCENMSAIDIALTACRMKIRLLANMLKTMATNHIQIS